jgi:hypothetical protein
MINERYKSMIRSISTMNKLIDNLTESKNPYEDTLGDESVTSKSDAQRKVGEKAKGLFQKIRTNLSQFKELEAEVPQSKNSSITANFSEEIGNDTLSLTFSAVNQPKLSDNDGNEVTPVISETYQFDVKGYGGGKGDFIKIKGKSGVLDRLVFLLNFQKIVKNNQPNEGKIFYCNNDACDLRGPFSTWQGKTQW